MLIEDELLAQQVIQSHLSKTEGLELVAVCENAMEATEILNRTEVDLIFLDIQLPGMTGLNFLRNLSNPPLVILTTAYSEYALESYEFNVVDYLLKPISFDRFERSVRKLTQGRHFPQLFSKQDESNDHLFIKSGTKFFKVDHSEIQYIQSMRDYMRIHTPAHKIITHQTMTEMERLLPAREFIRVHKSYIVSIAAIKTIVGNTIELTDANIPIGNLYKNQVMSRLVKKT